MSLIDHLAAAIALRLVGAAFNDLAARLRTADERAFEAAVLATLDALPVAPPHVLRFGRADRI